jgi:hypothetical protein
MGQISEQAAEGADISENAHVGNRIASMGGSSLDDVMTMINSLVVSGLCLSGAAASFGVNAVSRPGYI